MRHERKRKTLLLSLGRTKLHSIFTRGLKHSKTRVYISLFHSSYYVLKIAP
jgi:hypothetical protein